MRRQHAGRRRLAAEARGADGREHRAKLVGRTGDRRRAKRGDAEARQPRRDARDRVAAIERVGSLDAVHVDVDEARHDRVPPQIEFADRPATARARHEERR